MFSHCITAKLKANVDTQVSTTLKNDVLPLLRKQKGYRDDILLISPDRSALLAISFWETKADTEAYDRTAYPAVAKAMATVVEGTPKVLTYEVAHASFQKVLAQTAAVKTS